MLKPVPDEYADREEVVEAESKPAEDEEMEYLCCEVGRSGPEVGAAKAFRVLAR